MNIGEILEEVKVTLNAPRPASFQKEFEYQNRQYKAFVFKDAEGFFNLSFLRKEQNTDKYKSFFLENTRALDDCRVRSIDQLEAKIDDWIHLINNQNNPAPTPPESGISSLASAVPSVASTPASVRESEQVGEPLPPVVAPIVIPQPHEETVRSFLSALERVGKHVYKITIEGKPFNFQKVGANVLIETDNNHLVIPLSNLQSLQNKSLKTVLKELFPEPDTLGRPGRQQPKNPGLGRGPGSTV